MKKTTKKQSIYDYAFNILAINQEKNIYTAEELLQYDVFKKGGEYPSYAGKILKEFMEYMGYYYTHANQTNNTVLHGNKGVFVKNNNK